MKAAILYEMGRSRPYANSKPLVVEDVSLDPPGAGELLVKIKATGLCHSDLSVINGDRPRPVPMILEQCVKEGQVKRTFFGLNVRKRDRSNEPSPA